MKKISTNDLYLGALTDEQNNYIREILYRVEQDKASDVFYETDEYVINEDGISKSNNSLKIINSVKLKPFLEILRFKEEIGMLDIFRIYSLFMKDNQFLENCAFIFGIDVKENGNIEINEKCKIDGSIFINDFEELYNNSSIGAKVKKEEKEIHNIRKRKLF